MHVSELIEVVCGCHLSTYVEAPYPERGGLMLIGAPGMLKSTVLDAVERNYPDAMSTSDLNSQGLTKMRDTIAAGGIRTLVLPELQKIYDRHQSVAMNVEGVIRALVGEGFQSAAFEDQRINRLRARCVVVGALTPATQQQQFARWEDTGFNRRFLWSLVRLKDPLALEKATVLWQRIRIQGARIPRVPDGETIPNLSTVEERTVLRGFVKYQPGGSRAQQLQLLVKIFAVLKWWYLETNDTRDAMGTVRAFAESLGRDGATIELDDPEEPRVKAVRTPEKSAPKSRRRR